MIKKEDEHKGCYKCRDCVMFADADEESAPCCLAFDTYTFAKGDDKACGRFRMRSVKF